MPTYLHPGVYVEEIPSGSRPIEAVGTSTAAFLGYTTKGPMSDPTPISNFEQYKTIYGGIRDLGTSTTGDALGFAVYSFFQNGGGKAYIVRLAKNAVAASAALMADDGATKIMDVEAANEGAWANGLWVEVAADDVDSDRFKVSIGTIDGEITESTSASDEAEIWKTFEPLETFADLALVDTDSAKAADDPRYAPKVLEAESAYVRITPASGLTAGLTGKEKLDSGDDGTAPDTSQYSTVFTAFEKYPDVNIIALPGQTWDAGGGSDNTAIEAAIAHAKTMKNRMVVIDPTVGVELKTAVDVSSFSLNTSTYATLYYPWVEATNPFYSKLDNPSVPSRVLIPPCGFAAGIWAKTDGSRGVWKTPAGVETALLGAAKLQYDAGDVEQDVLNPLGVNCIRKLPSYGRVIWGGRTLATKADPEWRYIAVRRTAMMIEQSIYNGIQWAVFEPNDDRLWSALRANIGSFMDGLFRSGAFQGVKASDAYFVQCGIPSTMTQDDVDRGQVIVLVGFAPLKPAEFVIVRIQQKVGQN